MGESYDGAVRSLELAPRDSEQAGGAHFGVGGSALALGRPAEAIEHFDQAAKLTSGGAEAWTIGTRPDVHGRAFAAHALWLRGPRRRGPRDRARGGGAGARRRATRSASRSRWPTPAITHQMLEDEAGAAGDRRRAVRPVRALRLRVLPRVGADPQRLVAARRLRTRAGTPRHRQPEGGGLVRAHAVLAGPAGRRAAPRRRADAARATLDAAIAAGYRPRGSVVAAGGAAA